MAQIKFLPKKAGRACLSLFFLLVFIANLSAGANQISVAPYLDFHYSSNIFWDSSAVSDAIYSPGLALNFTTRQFDFFLNAESKIYQRNNVLNQFSINGGFNFFKKLSARGTMFFSPEFSLIQFHGDMSYLNSSIASIAVGMKHILSPQLFSRIGLNLRQSNYFEEDSFDHMRLAAFLEMSAFFKTQTTLRLTLGMNYLFFPRLITEIPVAVSAANKVEEFAAALANEPHYRHGNPDQPTPVPPTPPSPPNPPHPPSPPNPPGPPVPPRPEPDPLPQFISTSLRLELPQPFVAFRLAQGLGYKTGLIAEILYRKNQTRLQGLQVISASEWALQNMDEDFFWQGTRFSIALKTEAILKMETAADFSYFLKHYDSMEVLEMEGAPLLPRVFREDSLAQVTLKISKSFGNFSFYITGSYRKNVSNDLNFRYNFYTISTGLDYVI